MEGRRAGIRGRHAHGLRNAQACASPQRSPSGAWGAWLFALALLGFAGTLPGVAPAAAGAPGEEAGAPSGVGIEAEVDARPPQPPGAASVELERLLRLPDSFRTEAETRTGSTAAEWRGRFELARQAIEQARTELTRTEAELESASDSSSAWQVSAPGADSPETSPLSFRLRHQVKEQRAEIVESERRLRALEVEADLADVPFGWRK